MSEELHLDEVLEGDRGYFRTADGGLVRGTVARTVRSDVDNDEYVVICPDDIYIPLRMFHLGEPPKESHELDERVRRDPGV